MITGNFTYIHKYLQLSSHLQEESIKTFMSSTAARCRLVTQKPKKERDGSVVRRFQLRGFALWVNKSTAVEGRSNNGAITAYIFNNYSHICLRK